jgi:hypothetical protein
MVLAAGDESSFGWYRDGSIFLPAWRRALWCEDTSLEWHAEHAGVLDRLGVAVEKRGPRLVTKWTEDQARAFQLLHVFLHELGHHHDLMTTSSRWDAARGEPFAEQFALELEERMWDDFVQVFPL